MQLNTKRHRRQIRMFYTSTRFFFIIRKSCIFIKISIAIIMKILKVKFYFNFIHPLEYNLHGYCHTISTLNKTIMAIFDIFFFIPPKKKKKICMLRILITFKNIFLFFKIIITKRVLHVFRDFVLSHRYLTNIIM